VRPGVPPDAVHPVPVAAVSYLALSQDQPSRSRGLDAPGAPVPVRLAGVARQL